MIVICCCENVELTDETIESELFACVSQGARHESR